METTLMYHRGGGKSLGYPPNCLRTIEWAVEHGANGLEYDAVAARHGDDHRIVMIEPDLVADHGLDLDDLRWDDLADIDAGNGKTGRCEVATLADVLAVVDQDEIEQQIHIKGENPATVPTLAAELGAPTNITVTSFDLAVPDRVHEHLPAVDTGWIVKPDSSSGSEGTEDLTATVTADPDALGPYTDAELDRIRDEAATTGVDAVILCAPKIADADTIDFFRDDGFVVGGWGVGSNLDVARRMIDIGLDRFTIDNPEQLEM